MFDENSENMQHNDYTEGAELTPAPKKTDAAATPEAASATPETVAAPEAAAAVPEAAAGAPAQDDIPVIDDYYSGAQGSSYSNRTDGPAAHTYAPPVYVSDSHAQKSTPFPGSDKKAKPKSRLTKRGAALAVALCILFSAVFGIGGGVLGNYIAASAHPASLPAAPESGSDESGKSTESGKPPVTQQQASSGDDLGARSKTLTGVVDYAADSVVEITTEAISMSYYFQQLISTGAGSGVILTEDGYIATNNHVISGASKIEVTLRDGTVYSASLVGTDPENDLAVIKIDASGLTPATFADSDDLQVGQVAVAIGNPLGKLGGTVTEGIISALDRQINLDGQNMRLLQTSAAVNPGNSGGGLFDENGYLIGIVNAKSTGSEIEGLGFAIPSNVVKEVTNSIIGEGSDGGTQSPAGSVRLGVTVITIDDEQTANMYRVSEFGVYVIQVQRGSNASNAGIQPGDRIVSINDETVSDADDVSDIMADMSMGDTMRITVMRGGVEITTDVLLAG